MEFVYVVRRRDLFPLRAPHGLELLDRDGMSAVCDRIREHGYFVERRHAEHDAELKQVIPYCVVVRGDRVFVMRRLAAGGETRLHGKRTVGVGGHINPVDAGEAGARRADVLTSGMRREIDEEIVVSGAYDACPVGLLNDDSTDVGSVHVGLVSVVRTDAAVHVRETDVLAGELLDVPALRGLLVEERDTFETWSALVLDRIDDVLRV